MKLVHLPGGDVSLELAPSELPEVLRALLAAGQARRETHATFDLLEIGAARIVVMNEWDAPCLISANTAAVDLLSAIAIGPDARAAVG